MGAVKRLYLHTLRLLGGSFGDLLVVAPLIQFLAKYEAKRDKTLTFVDSKITVHIFVQEVTALAAVDIVYSPNLLD